VTLRARGIIRAAHDSELYPDSAPDPAEPAPVRLTAVPYFLWGNREPGPMRVWLPHSPHASPNRKEHR
jgi:DUF1680 family protein